MLLTALALFSLTLAPAFPHPPSSQSLAGPPLQSPEGAWSWGNVNIQGMGFVTGLLIQPEPPHGIFIKTDVGGTYRYDRQRETWQAMMDGFPLKEAPSLDIDGFALIPGESDGLVILAPRQHPSDQDEFGGLDYYGELWRTLDGGQTWTALGLLDKKVRVAGNGEYRGFSGERVGVDPAQPERILVATRIHGAFIRETNGTWNNVTGLPAVSPWVDPQDPSNTTYSWNTPGHTFVLFDQSLGLTSDGATRLVYLGDHQSGVYRSLDAGRSFTLLPGSPKYPTRASLAPDGRLYISTARQAVGPDAGLPEIGGLWRFEPGSATFIDITPKNPEIPSLKDVRPWAGIGTHPRRPEVLLAAPISSGRRLVSLDRGNSWTEKPILEFLDTPAFFPPPTPQNYFSVAGDWGVALLQIDPADPQRAWTQNGFGVLSTADYLAPAPRWSWKMQDLEELVLHTVLVPPVPFASGGAELVSACMDMMGFRHASATETPRDRIGKPLQIGQAQGLCYSGQKPENMAFVGWDTWVPWVSLTGRSSDNGRTWTPFPDTSPGISGRIVMSATNPLHLVWEPAQWRALKVSFDGGASWQGALDLDAEFDPLNPDWQVVGAAFHVSNPWWQGQHLAADRVDGLRFCRFSWGQWLESKDGGLTWRRRFNSWSLGAQAPPAFDINTRLVPHPLRSGEVWISCVPNSGNAARRLYRTTDGGQTVAPVPGVSEATQVAFGLGANPASPAIYILGRPQPSDAFGAYLSEDEGQTWTRISPPGLAFNRAAAMDGDLRRRGVVYVATSGRGIFMGRGPTFGQ